MLGKTSYGHAMAQDEAFRRAYEEHVGLVWTLVQAGGVPRAEQEDVVQETFLALHKQLHRLATADDVRRYLRGIVRFQCWKRWRLDNAMGRLASAIWQCQFVLDPTSGGHVPTPERETVLKDDLERVLRLLDGLSHKKREVFLLVTMESMTIDEVARLTGTNPNTVTSRLRAARKYLERALERELVRETWRYRWTT